MEWLNLKSSVLHAPEFIGSKPAARATWLAVSLWCASQENGGRIAGAQAWGNRQWQQTCGVTRREVDAAPLLLSWDAEVLIVWNYPTEHEAAAQLNRITGGNGGRVVSEAKRQAARANGAKGGRPRTHQNQTETQQEPTVNPSGTYDIPTAEKSVTQSKPTETQITQASLVGKPNVTQEPKGNPSENPTEWKVKEGKGRECARGGLPDSLNTPQFRERWLRWQTHWSSINHGKDMPEMTAYQQLEDLVKLGEDRAIAAINNSMAKGNHNRPLEPFQPVGQAPATQVRLGQNLTEGAA